MRNTSCSQDITSWRERLPITQAHLPGGKPIPLLKTMQTSICEKNCNYCCFRSGRDLHRVSLTPDELASAIVKLSNAGIAKGVFLSSAIAGGGVRIQDRIIATAEILRYKYQYPHYIHLKIMPGAEKDQVFQSMLLADRVSINLEGPDETSLIALTPDKSTFKSLLQTLELIHQIRSTHPPQNAWKQKWPSSCTQFVVGAVGETDLQLLKTTHHLHSEYHIARAYYSRFSPVKNTPFENRPSLNHWRQKRLYQASFLLRDYQFDLNDLLFNPAGNLDIEKDPKLAWAENNLAHQPVEINQANYFQLIKVPGIGPVTAKKIIFTRRNGIIIRDMTTLRKIGVSTKRAAGFILLNGRKPDHQPGLFTWNAAIHR